MMLYEAAGVVLARSTKWSWLKAWAMKIARHRGMKKAIVALARRLAVIMHRIWVDGTGFSWARKPQQHDNRAGSVCNRRKLRAPPGSGMIVSTRTMDEVKFACPLGSAIQPDGKAAVKVFHLVA